VRDVRSDLGVSHLLAGPFHYNLLACDPKTIRHGLRELEEAEDGDGAPPLFVSVPPLRPQPAARPPPSARKASGRCGWPRRPPRGASALGALHVAGRGRQGGHRGTVEKAV
jgi:hypothetical protein